MARDAAWWESEVMDGLEMVKLKATILFCIFLALNRGNDA